jgi:hypothetical protein
MAITELRYHNVENPINRAFERMGQYQWSRELTVNAIEAGATEILFGVDTRVNTRRRFVVDNGLGMSRPDLRDYMKDIGRSSKSVGGVHENFGIGSRVALLPWTDVAVVSRQTGSTWVVVVKEERGKYGLEEVELANGGIDTVWSADGWDDEYSCNFNDLIPDDWTSGTAVLLLGRGHRRSTDRGGVLETDTGLVRHLSDRFWRFPDNLSVRVLVRDANSETLRRVYGARQRIAAGDVPLREDCVALADGTKIHIFVRSEARPNGDYRPGYVAAMYHDELYGLTSSQGRFQLFGLPAVKSLTDRTYLIVEPPTAEPRVSGVLPSEERAKLLWRDVAGRVDDVPWREWGKQFLGLMPEWLRDEFRGAWGQQQLDDDEEQNRELLDVFRGLSKAKQLLARALRLGRLGDIEGEAVASVEHQASPDLTLGVEGPPPAIGDRAKPRRPRKGQVGEGDRGRDSLDERALPEARFVDSDSEAAVAIPEPYAAAWLPNHPLYAAGCVLLLRQHDIFEEAWAFWATRYPTADRTVVRKLAEDQFRFRIKSVVLHSEWFRSHVSADVLDEGIRGPMPLTLALMGVARPQLADMDERVVRATGQRPLAVPRAG